MSYVDFSQHHAHYYSTFTVGKTELRKVRQLSQDHPAKKQNPDQPIPSAFLTMSFDCPVTGKQVS